ncbi:MAG: carbohydrate kinase family protein, partial [Candidatus Omnitrophica bacterium]|nr:carbohydrate kinase family protein [Candidatus Omnitrophota bacterium]
TSRVLSQVVHPLVDGAAPSVAVNAYGVLGKDDAGNKVIRELAGWGTNTQHLTQTDKAGTSVTYVLSFGDLGRTFIQAINANGKLTSGAISDDAIRQANVLHIGGAALTPSFMENLPQFLRHVKAVNPKIKIIADTAADPTGKWNEAFTKDEEAYKLIDVLTTSHGIYEAIKIVGTDDIDTILNYFINKGVKTVFLKKGADGSYVAHRDPKTGRIVKMQIPVIKGLKNDAVVWEETGAGDSHTAGLVLSLLLGWDVDK